LDNRIEKHIDDLVGVFADPIIVFPGAWGETLPNWIKQEITLERLIEEIKAQKGEQPTGTDAEACAYLYTVNLTQPIDRDWGEIYIYLVTKLQKVKGGDMPEDLKKETLTSYQEQQLRDLKDWIYRHRVQARIERRRAAKREAKELEKAKAPVQLGLGL